ncbi:odorant receptor 98a-like [Drosophila tropicalis]|uniref:odorant receptor 98a-like n=1 Tax=Drosophila tropicalis TaxID=46794 RepID=UPI0035AB9CA8
MIFKALRNPGPQDMKSSADAFVYFEYGMTLAGLLPPSKGRKLYMIFRGLMIMWTLIYLPLDMILGCIKDFKNFTPDEFLTLLANVMNVAGCSVKVLGFYTHLSQYHKAKQLMDRMDEFFVNESDRHRIRYWVIRCNVIFIIFSNLYYSYCVFSFVNSALKQIPIYRAYSPFIDWRSSRQNLYCVFSYVNSALKQIPLYRDYNPFIDWRSSRQNLWTILFLQIILISFLIVQQLVVDVFNIIYGIMLRAHIEILRLRVQKFRTDPEETEQENYDELVKCIEQHKLILEYVLNERQNH